MIEQQQGGEQRHIEQHAGEVVDHAAVQRQIRQEADRRRCDEDEQRGQQLGGHRRVEEEAVHHHCEQHDPEHQPDAEKEPRDFGRAVRHAGNGHQYVAYHRNEPGRCGVLDLVVRMVNPRRHDDHGEHQMQRNAAPPHGLRPDGLHMQKGDGQQQRADGDGREEADAHRVVELGPEFAGVAQGLGAIAQQQQDKQRQRDLAQADAHAVRHGEHLRRFVPGDGQAGRSHDGGEQGDGEVGQPTAGVRRFGGLRCGSSGHGVGNS